MFSDLKDLREAFMPEIIQIADFGMTLGKKPLRSLKTAVKMTGASPAAVRQAGEMIRAAKMKKATGTIRLALVALANGRFDAAGNLAVTAAVEAAAAFRQNPQMAARVIATARGVVKSAVRGVMARSV